MSRWIIIGFAVSLAGASTAEAQWLYWMETSRTPFGHLALLRKPLDGGAREVVLPFNDLKFSTVDTKYAFDAVGGKLYWQERDAPASGNTRIWRSNLDGTSPEVFVEISGGADDPFISGSLMIVRPIGGTVPAVGTWGVTVMVLALLSAGTLVFRRRAAA